MENKQQSNSTSRRQLLPPLYPTNANAGRRSYHHRSSSLPPFPYNNPAATHFNSQQTSPYGSGSTASSSSYHYHQMLPLPLPHAHPSGSSAGSSTLHARSFSQTSMFGSGWDASGSSYQRLPSPPSQAHGLGGGGDDMGGNSALLQSEGAFSASSYYQMTPPSPLAMDPTSPSIGGVDGSSGGSISCYPTFVSSPETSLPLSDSSDGQTSSSSSGLPPLLTQSPASVDGMAHEYVLPPLPPTLPPSSLQTTTVDLEDELPLPPCGPPPSETTMDLEDIIGAAPECISLVDDENASHIVSRHNMDPDSLGCVNSSGDMGNNDSSSSRVHCPPPTPFTLPSPAYAMMKNEPLDWSFLVGRHAGSSSSSMQNEPIVFERKPVLPLLPSPELGAESSSRSGETSRGKKVAAGTLVKDFADGLFTQDEITEIMGEKALAEMVLINPKGVRRIIRNRAYSRIAKQRKTEYLSGLERKAELLEQQTKLLSAGLQSMQSTAHRLATENNAMKIRLHGLVQQQKLMIDLNETLQAEVQRLKLDAGVISGSQVSNGLYQQEQLQTYNQLTQLQQSQQQQGAHDNFTTDLQGSFI